jgi:hypothetical protein
VVGHRASNTKHPPHRPDDVVVTGHLGDEGEAARRPYVAPDDLDIVALGQKLHVERPGGQRLHVAGHCRVEDDFSSHRQSLAKGDASCLGTVLQDELHAPVGHLQFVRRWRIPFHRYAANKPASNGTTAGRPSSRSDLPSVHAERDPPLHASRHP